MQTKTLLASMVAAGLALTIAGPAAASSQVVDISAANGSGAIIALAAGTYTVSFIDSGQGGLYDGYSPWSSNSGCDGAGMNCNTGFVENLAMDFGHGTGAFDRVDGYQYGQKPAPGDNHIYATGAQALASIQTGDLVRATLPNARDQNAYSPTPNPITFTLGLDQSVNFFIFDDPYNDNRGGVSIRLTTPDAGGPGVPEPATWALMILGFGGVGAIARRRRTALA